MPKDYKYVGGRDDLVPRLSPRSRWLGFLAGLVLGGVFAIFVHFYHVLKPVPVASPTPVAVKPPGDAGGEKQSYDFFGILTNMKIDVPDYEKPEEVSYILQAGSFRTQIRAESLQERLKKLDLESEVQQVEVNDGSVWYRVRLGPYNKLSRVNNVKISLRKQGIESVVLKRN